MKKQNILVNKKIVIYILSFITPIIIMLIIYAKVGITPFGEKTILTSDMNSQYVSFFSYFRNNITNVSSLIYSFSKVLGGGMIGLIAYYLLSPLNLILLFFNTKTLIFGIEIITLLKIGLAGVTFAIFLNYIKKIKISTLIFSCAYALMSYNIIYQCNIMWLDAVILLPLIMLGINKLVKENKKLVYMIFLTLGIVINYYIGIMLCIFSIIYFIYTYLNNMEKISLENIKKSKNKIISFLSISLIAGMISAFVLLPTFIDLLGGKAKFSFSSIFSFNEYFKFFDIFSRFYTASYAGSNINNYMPNIFCGIITLFLAILYFFDKRNNKEKILSGLVILIFIISFQIKFPNLIWHGFNEPIGFPYRNSFIFCAFILMLAHSEYEKIIENNINKKNLVLAVGMFIITTMLINKFTNLAAALLYFDIFIVTITAVLLYYKSNKLKYNVIIIVFVLVDLSINTYFGVNGSIYENKNNINDFIKKNNEIINDLKSKDKSFYRIEKNYNYERNDPMLLNYNGISHYSSSEKEMTTNFIKKLGYNQYYVWANKGNSGTVAGDSFLNIKYLLKDNKSDLLKYLYEKNNIYVYENEFVLPFAYCSDKEIGKIILNQDNPFENLNNIYKSLNSTLKSNGNIFIEFKNYSEKLINVDKDIKEKVSIYNKKEAVGKIEYEIKIENDNKLYIHFPNSSTVGAKLYINNEYKQEILSESSNGIIELGKYNIGEQINIRIEYSSDNISYGNPLFYYEDISILNNYHNELEKRKMNIEEYNNTKFIGKINNNEKNKYLLINIPFDKGWTVLIDGKKVEKIKILNALIAVDIPEGEHKVEIRYSIPGLTTGISITTIGIILAILLIKQYIVFD